MAHQTRISSQTLMGIGEKQLLDEIPDHAGRLGKLACPRVNDDQKIGVDDQKCNSGRPHDYWVLESLFYKIVSIISIFLLPSKWNTLEDDHKYLWTTSFNI